VGAWSTETDGIACGFVYKSFVERASGELIVNYGAATLRVALTQTFDIKDKVRAHGNTWKIAGIENGRMLKILDLEKAGLDG
jgi:hypothetical protein